MLFYLAQGLLFQVLFEDCILELAHEKHPEIIKTKALLRENVWWPGMDSDVENFIKECHPC